jgi:hypothetical protein
MDRVRVVRRLFWFSMGAASAVWISRRGEAVLREVQQRGVLSTVDLIAGKATGVIGQIDTLARSRRAQPDANVPGADSMEDER